MEDSFRRDAFTEGILRGIEKVGEVLARHFPRSARDVDELPDTIDEEP